MESERKPEKEFYVWFQSIEPTLVGPVVLQKLVNTRGSDIKVMDAKNRKAGWRTAADFGFSPVGKRAQASIAVPEETVIEDSSLATDQNKIGIYSPNESLSRIMKIVSTDKNQYVTIINTRRRSIGVPAHLAYIHIRFKGACLVRD